VIGYSCPPLSLLKFREAADLVAPHFGLWEIVSEADHYLPGVEARARELLDTTRMRLSVHAPYSNVNISAFEERLRRNSVEAVCDVIRSAHRLGAGPVTIHAGIMVTLQRSDRQRHLLRTRQSLEEISALAEELSIAVALENMPSMERCVCQGPEEVLALIDGLEIGICLDTGHANTTGTMGAFLDLAPRLVNMHVHDNMGKLDEHLPPGSGTADLKLLRGVDYGGNHIIEANSPNMEEAAASLRFLERLLG
jgi:sugar phosphate isomerase/epimerase